MCQTLAEGGKRCAAASATGKARQKMKKALDRQVRAQDMSAAFDSVQTLARFEKARALYGDVITPMTMDLPDSVHATFDVITRAGFKPLVVGGSVRDALTDGRAPKDVDVEVYGATLDEVTSTLRDAGYRVDEVGRAFGVLKVLLDDGTDLDVSVPRRDNHTGAGHRGFSVETDTNMTAVEAAARRDFTINALGYDPEYGVCVDPYHGRADLNANILRATSEAFAEDPLRVLRGFQFAARYGMALDPDTAEQCRTLLGRATELPVERARAEWAKFYTKGTHLGHGLSVLAETGWDATAPGLVNRNSDALRARVDHAAQVADEAGLDTATRTRLVAATITRGMSDEQARAFINTTVDGGDLQRAAYGLSRTTYPSLGTTDHLTRAFAHAAGEGHTSIREWTRLATVTADVGHPESAPADPQFAAAVLADAERLGCADGPQPDLLLGRDIIAAHPGRKPGPWTGQVQRAARQAQIEGTITTREEADAWLATYDEPVVASISSR